MNIFIYDTLFRSESISSLKAAGVRAKDLEKAIRSQDFSVYDLNVLFLYACLRLTDMSDHPVRLECAIFIEKRFIVSNSELKHMGILSWKIGKILGSCVSEKNIGRGREKRSPLACVCLSAMMAMQHRTWMGGLLVGMTTSALINRHNTSIRKRRYPLFLANHLNKSAVTLEFGEKLCAFVEKEFLSSAAKTTPLYIGDWFRLFTRAYKLASPEDKYIYVDTGLKLANAFHALRYEITSVYDKHRESPEQVVEYDVNHFRKQLKDSRMTLVSEKWQALNSLPRKLGTRDVIPLICKFLCHY
jgi:hypothetical protein